MGVNNESNNIINMNESQDSCNSQWMSFSSNEITPCPPSAGIGNNKKIMKVINALYNKKVKVKKTIKKKKGTNNKPKTTNINEEKVCLNSTFDSTKSDDTNDGFQKMESKKQRRRRFDRENINSLVTGAPPPLRYVFLSRVQDGDAQTIKRYLRSMNVWCNKIELVSHKNSKYKSFKISIPKQNLQDVLSDEFWSPGIYCKIWKESKRDNVNNVDNYKTNQYYNTDYINKVNKFSTRNL